MKNLITTFNIFFFFNIVTLSAQYKRPQEPIDFSTYISEDVSFVNPEANHIKLAGTLTIPKNIKKPAVAILISGSGPQDRDAFLEPFNHKPFLVLSDYLTKNGIAVLRFDERGIAKSEGVFHNATSFDFASDVEAAVQFLKERKDINPTKIGLIGHSEGGLIAPIAASRNNDVAFVISLAGTGVNGGEILRTQSRKMLELRGTPKMMLDENEKLTTIIYNAIQQYKDIDTIKTKITHGLNDFKEKHPTSIVSPSITPVLIEQQFKILKSKWLLEFIRIEPKTYLKQLSCPVLFLNGSKDVQVLPEVNLPEIEKALEQSNSKDITIKELEDLNHLFQTCETGATDEYKDIEETFSPKALKIIADWINQRF